MLSTLIGTIVFIILFVIIMCISAIILAFLVISWQGMTSDIIYSLREDEFKDNKRKLSKFYIFLLAFFLDTILAIVFIAILYGLGLLVNEMFLKLI